MVLRSVAVVVAVAALAACDRTPSAPATQTLPLSPSALTSHTTSPASGGLAASVAQGREEVLVNMLDACDSATFDAVLGPGSCVRQGGMQFPQFIAQLTRLTFVGPWHFAPSNANVPAGSSFVAMNKGGEVHTFTQVAQFGGGIVPQLNRLANLPTVAPECTALEGDDFVAPGGTYQADVNRAGTVKFQCCIHPWMRLEATVSSR